MIALFVVVFFTSSQIIQQGEGLKKIETKQTIVSYSIEFTSGEVSLTGFLKDKRTKAPLYNINIEVEGEKIGTVPDLDGKFELVWPRKKGDKKKVIKFDKTGFEKFQLVCKYP